MNKKILTVDVVNGYLGYTSNLEENISFATDDIHRFIRDLEEYLLDLHKRKKIILQGDSYEDNRSN